jgi:hypothetical protein
MLETSHCITFHSQMIADDTAAMKVLEEDRQAEAILKRVRQGNSSTSSSRFSCQSTCNEEYDVSWPPGR